MRWVRTIFLSDIHLGTRACQADRLLAFLRVHEAEYVYLLGDIIDFWSLRCGGDETVRRKALIRPSRSNSHHSHFRQRPVIRGRYFALCAADPWRAAIGATDTQEETIMIDQQMHWPFAIRSDAADRTRRPADIGQTLAAIVAITKSEWMAQRHATPDLGEMAVNRNRFAHPSFGPEL